MTVLSVVEKQIVVLCERTDIAGFIDCYIKHLRNQGVVIPNLLIVNLQGLDNVSQYLKVLESNGLDNVKKIVLIADAGLKRRDTEYYLFKVKEHSFLKDFEYDVFLFPGKSVSGNWMPGFLEDLLLPALQESTSEQSGFHNLHNITGEYIFSVHNSRGRENKFINYNRNFLYSYFSGTERFVGLRLGEAAAKNAFNLEYEGFADLKFFLKQM